MTEHLMVKMDIPNSIRPTVIGWRVGCECGKVRWAPTRESAMRRLRRHHADTWCSISYHNDPFKYVEYPARPYNWWARVALILLTAWITTGIIVAVTW